MKYCLTNIMYNNHTTYELQRFKMFINNRLRFYKTDNIHSEIIKHLHFYICEMSGKHNIFNLIAERNSNELK